MRLLKDFKYEDFKIKLFYISSKTNKKMNKQDKIKKVMREFKYG